MKSFAPLLVLFCVIFAGCDSLPQFRQQMREKFTGTPPRTRVVAADATATFEAARAAVNQMNFRIVRAGAAQGEIDAISGLASDNALRGTRQLSMTVRLIAAPTAGGTEVQLWLKEIIEEDARKGGGRATESPLRDTPLYEVFFRHVQQALGQ